MVYEHSSAGNPIVEASAGRSPHVLIVEDQLMLGMYLATLLEDIGCKAVGPVAQVVTALPIAMKEPLDAALLDVYLADEPIEPIAAVLARRGIPFAFVTAYAPEKIPAAFRDRPLIRKPFLDEEVRSLVLALVDRANILGQPQ
jgi:CheY-like chemotaxis protein